VRKMADVRARVGAAAAVLVISVLAGVLGSGALAAPRPEAGKAGGSVRIGAGGAPGVAPGVSSGFLSGGVDQSVRAIRCPAGPPIGSGFDCGLFPSYVISSNGTLAGVTATGQASVKGDGKAVRDEAIRQAVADALEQAQAAAAAGGVTLGKVIDMQISSPGYPYPLIERAAPASGSAEAGSGTGIAGGAAVTVSPCPPEATCVEPQVVPKPVPAVPQVTFVSVTVTWSIG
jgi:hypothetical protein